MDRYDPHKTKELLPECEFAVIESIEQINHTPHPYMVGTQHVVYAADHNGGMLTSDVCRKIPCAWKGPDNGNGNSTYGKKCTTSYDEHTYDNVALVKLKRDVLNSELGAWLYQFKEWAVQKKLAGFAFPNMNYGNKKPDGYDVIDDRPDEVKALHDE